MAYCLLRPYGVAKLGVEKRDGVAAFATEDGELFVRGVADLLGADLGTGDRWLVCLGLA